MQVQENGLSNNLDNEMTFNDGMYAPYEIQVKNPFSLFIPIFVVVLFS